MSKMLFSLIVASYNNGRYLRELFDSVLKQSYENWELIFVDDNSTDFSLEMIEKFCKEDRRVRVFKHEENLGVGAAFKTAAENSQGEIIGMLGADDALVPEAITKMVAAHERNPGASLINSDIYHCDENMVIQGMYKGVSAVPAGESLIDHLSISSFATFKKSAYDKTSKFNANFRSAVDHDIYLKLDEQGTLFYIHEPLYLYRVHPGGVSQAKNSTRAAQYGLLGRRDAYYRRLGTQKKNIPRKEFKEMMITYYLRESYYYRDIDMSKCNQLLRQAFVELPIIIFERDYWSILIRSNLNTFKNSKN